MTTRRRLFALAFALLLPSLPAAATCGGGGGGGTGGVVPDLGGGQPTVYRVAWKVLSAGAERPQAHLAVYWFPTSPEEARSSPLQTSRSLSLAGGRCVAMAIVPSDNQALHEAFKAPAGTPLVVLANPDGTDVARVAATDGKLDVKAVEKLLATALEDREIDLKEHLDAAEKKAAADRDGAVADYRRIWDQRCLFPSLGRRAAKALKKLGVTVDEAALHLLGPDGLADPDVRGHNPGVEATLRQGLDAEIAARYRDA